MKKSIIMILEDIQELKEKSTISFKMTAAALIVAAGIGAAHVVDNIEKNFELPSGFSFVKEDTKIDSFNSIVNNQKSGIYQTGLGDLGVVFSAQDINKILKNMEAVYGIKPDSKVEQAIVDSFEVNSESLLDKGEIQLYRIPYGENKYLNLLKYNIGSKNGNFIDNEINLNYEFNKEGFSHIKSLRDNVVDLIVLQELYKSSSILWNKTTNISVTEFMADYSAVLTVGLNRNMSYQEIQEMLISNSERNINRMNTKFSVESEDSLVDSIKDLLTSKSESKIKYTTQIKNPENFSKGMYLYLNDNLLNNINNILPSKEEYELLKKQYLEYKEGQNTSYNFIASYVLDKTKNVLPDLDINNKNIGSTWLPK